VFSRGNNNIMGNTMAIKHNTSKKTQHNPSKKAILRPCFSYDRLPASLVMYF
jgi:hypothetical protein